MRTITVHIRQQEQSANRPKAETLGTLEKKLKEEDGWIFQYEGSHQLEEEILKLIPTRFAKRSEITGLIYELVDGEIGGVLFTTNSRPYDLSARYHWVRD